MKNYDYIVLGGGSGGLATANRAAEYGKKVLLVEKNEIGGTCVNRGCVPKRIRWFAAQTKFYMDALAPDYGFSDISYTFSYKDLKKSSDAYIERAKKAYFQGMEERGTEWIQGKGVFIDPHTLEIGGEKYHAEHITIATGAHAMRPDFPGADLIETSETFFEHTELPRRVAVLGGGYIGTELSNLLFDLGVETHFFIREDRILHNFEPYITEALTNHMIQEGMHLHFKVSAESIEKQGDELILHLSDGTTHTTDRVLWTAGIIPNTENLGLENIGVKLDERGHVLVDAYQNTNVEGLYALGDVVGNFALTPVAIQAGRRLSDRLFGGMPHRHLKYENIPSVVFAHPPLGSVGLTEVQAREKYEKVTVYTHTFTDLHSGVTSAHLTNYFMMICAGEEEVVVGIHIFGPDVDEILQGFAVGVSAGLTKQDFDDTVAIHPTSAEELVTLR